MNHVPTPPTIAYVLPTLDRPGELAITLDALGRRPGDEAERAEVIVVDNGSSAPARVPARLANGMPVRLIELGENRGTAARNVGAEATGADWLVMLDDDSAPRPIGPGEPSMAAFAASIPEVYGAVGGEILLPSGAHESGGMPEVITGCGALIRRGLFVGLGGYDRAFDYYAEEYDLCARIIGAGRRVGHTDTVGFLHRKVAAGRSFGRIIHRLVRNNGWTLARYAPDAVLDRELTEMIERYRGIGDREGVRLSFDAGLAELERTLGDQPRRPLDEAGWARFTGRASIDRTLLPVARERGLDRVTLVAPGKGAGLITRTLEDAGVEVRGADASRADGTAPAPRAGGEPLVVGTLSPGPVCDALAVHGAALACRAWDDGLARASAVGSAERAGAA